MSHTVTYPSFEGVPDEAKFTTPRRPWCPDPSLWHAADSDSTEFEVLELVAAFVRALQPELVVETGSAFGYGSEAIGRALKANGHGRLVSLEVDPKRAKLAKKRCADLPVDILEKSSLDWMPQEEVGFAFFDSIPEHRGPEFEKYYPMLKKGSVVCFHDAADHHQVWPSVVRLEQEGKLKAFRIANPRGLAIAQVI